MSSSAAGTSVIGVLEVNSIADGIKALDAMVKEAPVTVLQAEVINPGKYLIIITGDVASVEAAMTAGGEAAAESLLDRTLLKNLDAQVIPALTGCFAPEEWDALGLLETFTVAAAVNAADLAPKVAAVRILSIINGNEMGGKAMVKISGPVGDVNAAMDSMSDLVLEKGQLCKKVIIPGPHLEIKGFVCGN